MGAEAEESDSNWIVSYADLITLLMGFFVLMFSFSNFDVKQFDQVRENVSKQFGGTYTLPFEQVDASLRQVVVQERIKDDVLIDQDSSGISIVFKSAIFFEQGGIELSAKSTELLSKIIDIMAQAAKDQMIFVEGHTDDSPIATDRFPSNWELSAARASLVVRMLEAKGFSKERLSPQGFADSRPILPNRDEAGKPIPDNQAQNRRVVIRIARR
jgi:chemotaxis protein MotB